MTAIIRRSAAAMLVMAIVSLGAFFSAETASAQCPGIRVYNHIGVPTNVCLYNAAGVVWCSPVVGPGGPWGPFPPPPGFFPVGAVDANGAWIPFNPGPPIPPCTGCTPRMLLRPGLIGTVCYDPTCCNVWIFP